MDTIPPSPASTGPLPPASAIAVPVNVVNHRELGEFDTVQLLGPTPDLDHDPDADPWPCTEERLEFHSLSPPCEDCEAYRQQQQQEQQPLLQVHLQKKLIDVSSSHQQQQRSFQLDQGLYDNNHHDPHYSIQTEPHPVTLDPSNSDPLCLTSSINHHDGCADFGVFFGEHYLMSESSTSGYAGGNQEGSLSTPVHTTAEVSAYSESCQYGPGQGYYDNEEDDKDYDDDDDYSISSSEDEDSTSNEPLNFQSNSNSGLVDRNQIQKDIPSDKYGQFENITEEDDDEEESSSYDGDKRKRNPGVIDSHHNSMQKTRNLKPRRKRKRKSCTDKVDEVQSKSSSNHLDPVTEVPSSSTSASAIAGPLLLTYFCPKCYKKFTDVGLLKQHTDSCSSKHGSPGKTNTNTTTNDKSSNKQSRAGVKTRKSTVNNGDCNGTKVTRQRRTRKRKNGDVPILDKDGDKVRKGRRRKHSSKFNINELENISVPGSTSLISPGATPHRRLREFRCPLPDCTAMYAGRQTLQRHWAQDHGLSAEEVAKIPMPKYRRKRSNRLYECSICNKFFPRKYSRERHMKVHTRKVTVFRCSACDIVFQSLADSQIHETIHRLAGTVRK